MSFTEFVYDIVIKNLSLLQEENRYYNWYHGYTEVLLPYPDFGYDVFLKVNSFAPTGSIATQSFGKKNDADVEIESNIYYEFSVFPGAFENVTLSYNIEIISMGGNYKDEFKLNDQNVMTNNGNISKNITVPTPLPYYDWWPGVVTKLSRKVSKEDTKNMNLIRVPGFNITWHYNGLELNNKQENRYKNFNYPNTNTIAFIR